MKPCFLFLLFAALPLSAVAYDVVESCRPLAQGPCEKFRGRANATMGSATTVIWKVGSKRILAWSGTRRGTEATRDGVNFHRTLYADFEACPLEADRPGHRIDWCVESVGRARWENIPD